MQTSALLHHTSHHQATKVVTPTNDATTNATDTMVTAPQQRGVNVIVHPELFVSVADDDDDDDSDEDSIQSDDDEFSVNTDAANHEPELSMNTDPISHDGNRDDILTSFLDKDVVVNQNRSDRVSSPLGEPKEVRFRDDVDQMGLRTITFEEDEDDVMNKSMEQLNEQEKESFVLHEQLRNVLSDLSAEKAKRFQKEKSLIKLAKAFTKRKNDIVLYERKLIQMAKFINTLQLQLQQQTEQHVQQISTTTMEHQQQIQILNEGMDTLRIKLHTTQAELQTVLQKPPQTLEETMQPKALPSESETLLKSNRSNLTIMGFSLWILLCACVMTSVWNATTQSNGITTTKQLVQNVLCAPIRPGTVLLPSHDRTVMFKAPWWIPGEKSDFKQTVHNIVCSNIPRATMQWTGDRLLIYDENQYHNTRKVLLQGRGPAGVQFYYSGKATIHLLRTKRAGIELPTPWIV
jgi:hypothetical protein